MKYFRFIFLLLAGQFFLSGHTNATINRYPLNIDFIADDGRVFSSYPTNSSKHDQHRAWLEAVNGQNYKIRIRNLSNRRIGVVVAVDGRNIISGQKSNLDSNERMYILNPYQQNIYEGWRTGSTLVNRFYFTNAGDSYAGAWGDYSAMGVIAVAVYDERVIYRELERNQLKQEHKSGKFRSAPPSSSESIVAEDSAGTGFGEEIYSPVRVVEFKPNSYPTMKYFFKYEWKETLCKKGIINCYTPPTPNRFWPEREYGYAPYPPS